METVRVRDVDKRKIVNEIQTYLAEELLGLLPGAEKGTLDAAANHRVREIQSQLTMYKFLPLREYGAEDVVVPSSLVELEFQGRRAFYFMVPSGGGLIMRVEENPVQVITPSSPLGEALLGRKQGDTFEVGTQKRVYRIVSLT